MVKPIVMKHTMESAALDQIQMIAEIHDALDKTDVQCAVTIVLDNGTPNMHFIPYSTTDEHKKVAMECAELIAQYLVELGDSEDA